MDILHIVWVIIVGVVIGIIARLIHPGKENMGIIMTVLIGVVGAVVAGVIVEYAEWSAWWISFIIAVALAVILIEIYARIKGKKTAA